MLGDGMKYMNDRGMTGVGYQRIRVSVIIPVYNAEKYIKECMDSVLNQTLKEFEMICIDDGSKDSSPRILKEYQQADSRIRVLQQENKGSGPARNRGMKEACGKYIAFLDADDFWYDEFVLEKMVTAADEKSCNVTGAFWGHYKDRMYERAGLHQEYFDEKTAGRWIDFKEEQNCFNYWSYLFKRDFLINNNLFFPPYYRFQDPPFLTETLARACSYYVIPVDWYCYRIEYKDTFLRLNRITDFMKGVLDVMEMAERYCLQKLYEEMFSQMNMVTPYIIKGIMNGDMELMALLCRINEHAPHKAGKPEVLEYIGDAIYEKGQRKADAFRNMIAKSDRIIIYGAGFYGNILLRQIEKNCDGITIVFAETGHPKAKEVCGRKCLKIDELAEEKENSLVIISVSRQTQPALISNIKRLGFENYMCLDMELMTALECMG